MKEFRVGKPISIGDMTLTPIERVEVCRDAWTAGVVVWASRVPVAVLLSGPSGTFAATVAPGEWRLADLLARVGGHTEAMVGTSEASTCSAESCPLVC